MALGGKEKSATGIHFSGSTVRVVELTGGRRTIALRAAVVEPIEAPFDPLQPDVQRQALIRALQRVGNRQEVDFSRPCVALDYPAYLLKRRSLIAPLRRGSKACRINRQHLQWEAEQVLGDQLGEFNLDYVLLDGYGFVVAVRRLMLDQYSEFFARAGIDDLTFDIAPFALYNGAEGAGILAGSRSILLIELGEGGAYVLQVMDSQLRGVKRCSARMNSLQAQLELLERCVAQVEEPPQQVWIAGSLMEEALTAELEAHVGIPCAPFTTFAGLEGTAAAGQPQPLFAVAAGLAHRRLSE